MGESEGRAPKVEKTLCPRSHTVPLEYSTSSSSAFIRSNPRDKAVISLDVMEARVTLFLSWGASYIVNHI